MKEAFVNDIGEIEECSYQNRQEILDRFKRGKRCFVASFDGNIVGYLWISYKDEYIPDIEYLFNVPDKSVYIYNVRVKKKHRGKGVFLSLLNYVCLKLNSESMHTAYTAILEKSDVCKPVFFSRPCTACLVTS